jgi:D-lactate dehydrogenase (cytochrome)
MNMQTVTRMHAALDSTVLQELTQLLGERVTISSASCMRHGQDESYHAPFPPDAVAYPTSNEEVAAIVKICNLG